MSLREEESVRDEKKKTVLVLFTLFVEDKLIPLFYTTIRIRILAFQYWLIPILSI